MFLENFYFNIKQIINHYSQEKEWTFVWKAIIFILRKKA